MNEASSYGIPQRTKDGIDRYAQHGIRPGGFLTAVLSNDLKGAFGAADMENRGAMFEIVSYCYNEIPANCWGSARVVEHWIEAKATARAAASRLQRAEPWHGSEEDPEAERAARTDRIAGEVRREYEGDGL